VATRISPMFTTLQPGFEAATASRRQKCPPRAPGGPAGESRALRPAPQRAAGPAAPAGVQPGREGDKRGHGGPPRPPGRLNLEDMADLWCPRQGPGGPVPLQARTAELRGPAHPLRMHPLFKMSPTSSCHGFRSLTQSKKNLGTRYQRILKGLRERISRDFGRGCDWCQFSTISAFILQSLEIVESRSATLHVLLGQGWKPATGFRRFCRWIFLVGTARKWQRRTRRCG